MVSRNITGVDDRSTALAPYRNHHDTGLRDRDLRRLFLSGNLGRLSWRLRDGCSHRTALYGSRMAPCWFVGLIPDTLRASLGAKTGQEARGRDEGAGGRSHPAEATQAIYFVATETADP
jgi:hypothetical protein